MHASKLFAVACLAALSGCSGRSGVTGSNPTTPEALAEQYHRAVEAQDVKALGRLCYNPPGAEAYDPGLHLTVKFGVIEGVTAAPLEEADEDEIA